MTPEFHLLLETLRCTRVIASPAINWPTLLDLAESHGILPLFCKEYPEELPDIALNRVRSQWTSSAFLANELTWLLEHFALYGIEVLPLKGPLLGQILYGSPALRPCEDLDLLVQAKDFERAQGLLNDLGFSPVYYADDYHQAFQRNNTFVELHFSVAPPSSPTMDLEAAWGRAPEIIFFSKKARFFAKPDLLIYLVIHAVKHEFARLVWVLDAARILTGLNDMELHQAFAFSDEIGIHGALVMTCVLASSCFNVELPALAATAIARDPSISSHAARLLEKILAGSATPQTNQQGARLFVQLESDARNRWAQRLRLFKPSHQDHLWAQQHRIHARWIPILRPLRLLWKHGAMVVWRTLFVPGEPPNKRTHPSKG